MWLKFIVILVLFHRYIAVEIKMCMTRSSLGCDLNNEPIRCQHGIASFTKLDFEYLFEKKSSKTCCFRKNAHCTRTDPKLLEDLRNKCVNNLTCLIRSETIKEAVEEVAKHCRYGDDDDDEYYGKAIIVYHCSKEKSKALPATDGATTTGDTGSTTVVVVSVISVLVVLVIVLAVLGVVIYKRRQRKNNNKGNISNPEGSGHVQVNTGFEDDYNTIPADYHEIPNDLNKVLRGAKADEQGYFKIVQGDSVKYSTIVLNDDLETDKSAYFGYDKTNRGKINDANRLNNTKYLHTYSHLSETTDTYNRVKETSNKHGVDKDYSKFEAETVDDYSHLNDKDKTSNAYNDYNHLQTNDKPSGPVKRMDSYEQPGLKSVADPGPKDERTFKTPDSYETLSKSNQPEQFAVVSTKDSTDGRLRRVDSYEQPVFKGTTDDEKIYIKHNPKSNDKPVNFKQCDNVTDVVVNTDRHLKRVDSYEQPVLLGVTENETELKTEQNSSNRSTVSYETPVNLEETYRPTVDVHNVKLKRVDSYETPVLKS